MLPLLLAMTLTSPDLKDGAMIPKAFVWNKDGCAGENRTPHLRWNGVPAGTSRFFLSVIDHDAPKPHGWIHWLVMIPASARSIGPDGRAGVKSAQNDFGTLGWGGPCPPPGELHHYTVELKAQDPHGRVLGSARMIPVYKR